MEAAAAGAPPRREQRARAVRRLLRMRPPFVAVALISGSLLGACSRSPGYEESRPIAVRALALLPPLSTGRALFAGESLGVRKTVVSELSARETQQLAQEVGRAAEAGDLLARTRLLTARGDFEAALVAADALLERGGMDRFAVERAAVLLERHRIEGRPADAVAAIESLANSPDQVAASYDRVLGLCSLNLTQQANVELLVLRRLIGGNTPLPVAMQECVQHRQPEASFGKGLPAARRQLDAGNSEPLRRVLAEDEVPRLLASGIAAGSAPVEATTALLNVTGDDFDQRLLSELASSPEAGEVARRWLLAEQRSRDMRPEDALVAIDRRVDAATVARAPAWNAQIELTKIASLFYLQRYRDAIARAQTLRSRPLATRWHDLVGRSLWLEGLSRLQLGQAAQALPLFVEAGQRFTTALEPGLVATMRTLEADGRSELGDFDRSLAIRVAALPELVRYGLAGRRAVALEAASFGLQRRGFPAAALTFLDEAASTATEDPLTLAEQGWRRSLALLSAGRGDEALAASEAALVAANRIVSPAFRERTRAGLEAARAEALVAKNPRDALAALRPTIARYQAARFEWFLPDMLLASGRAHRALGEGSAALTNLERAFAAAERWEGASAGDIERGLHLEIRRRIVDEAVDAALRGADDPRLALQWVLRARRSGAVSTMADCQLDSSTALAVYSLPDRLVRWTCRDERLEASTVEVDRQKLERSVTGLRRSILLRSDPESFRADAEALFDWLLGPVAKRLRAGAEVRLLVDGELTGIPFAALRDRVSGRWAAELGEVVAVDSWRGSEIGLPGLSPDAQVLIVANPTLRSELQAAYPSLPGAEREARAIEALFPHSRLLVARAASREAIISGLPSASVLHVAAHGVANAADPGRATLLLAPESGGEEWTAAQIAERRREHLRLVVLSACESGEGFATSAVGSLSLARAFQQSGAGAVVGTLWPIDDESGARFMTRFYTALAAGDPPPTALTRSQRAFIDSADPRERALASWAGYFIAAGASPALTERGGS